MELQGFEQSIGVNEYLYEGMAEQPVDADLTLPDYCPDVQRILKCMVCPRVNSVQVAGDRVTAEGSALVRVIYVNENSRLCSYDQSYPFSKYVEAKGLDAGCCANVKATVSYVNCRAVSQRRVDVHGMLNLAFQVSKKRDENFLCGAQGGGVQIKKKMKRIVSVIGDTERAFPLSEVMEMDSSKAPIGQILHTSGIALVDDVKAISNKLLIKGSLEIKILYVPDGEQSEVATLAHSIPISQIIELEGVDEDAQSYVRLQVAALDVLPKTDVNGETRLIDITARVSAMVSAGREVELPLIMDAYSTQGDLRLEYKNTQLRRMVESGKDTFIAKNALELQNANQVLGIWCGDVQANTAAQDGALAVQGTVSAHVLYLDSEQQPAYIERPVDFNYQRPLHEKVERLQCDPQVLPMASGWTMGADGAVELKLEMQVTYAAYAMDTDRVVAGMEPMEQDGKREEPCALTIYFSNPGETVWDIARRYNTTVDAVQRENNLTAEQIDEKRMLLIPRAEM